MENEDQKDKNMDKSNEILSDEFFSEINNLKKLNEKKSKIDIITNYLNENKSINSNNISKLYDFLLSNLNENNNNYVLSQLKLIETLIKNNPDKSHQDFQTFAKNALPKLFDKYYLQNQKINDNVTNILNNFIHNKILTLQDYYPHIENISLDEEDNYKNNILNLLWNNIEQNEDINEAKIPKGILDIFHKLSQDNDNTISDTAKKTVQILNQRNNEVITENNKIINEENKQENIIEKNNENKKEKIVETDLNKIENNEENNTNTEKDKNENINKNDDFDVKNALEQIEQLIKSQEIKTNNNNNNINNKLENKNSPKIENKEEIPIEKKESKENNNNINTNINEDNNIQENNTKEGGLKRSAIQGKLNKFRKQFGKPKKSKEIENAQKEEINNSNNNNKEYKRTNTIEEMFKKKLEDGFDTETNNILDLRKDNDNNCLNEIEGKLGINFNKELKENNNNNKNITKDISLDNQKKIINPDDRPIHPFSKNLKFDFDLDFEQQEKIINNNNNSNNNDNSKEKEKKSPKNFKNIIISKDLEELGKMPITNNNNKTSSSNNINSDKTEEDNNIENKIKPFDFDTEEKKDNGTNNNNNLNNQNNKDDINLNLNLNITNTLTDINKTIDNLNNLNIIKKPSNDERRPKLKIDDFQKKLELALEQEKVEVDKENQEEEEKKENDDKENNNKNKYKEDPRFDNIKSILGNKIVDNLLSNKWEQKKEAYELIKAYIESNDLDINNSNDLFEYLRFKLKNFKETNFNVNREAINVFISLVKKKFINKENLLSVILGYLDKITDPKLKDNFLILLNSCLDIIEPNLLLKNLLLQIPKKSNPKLFIEYSLYFSKVVEKYNFTKDLPYKELTEFSKTMANNSNPQCRNSATNLICILYRYYGDEVHKLIKDIKDSTLKNIENEISKITVIERKNSLNTKQKSSNKKRNSEIFDSKISINGGEKTLNGGAKSEIKQNVISDISKKITPQILKNISEGKWSEKKDACEQIEKILKESNMKILPNGLNELMNLIKKKLTDGNKNIVKMIINLLGQLIEALKHHFKQYSKSIAINLIPNLSDKNQLFRNEIQICFDKWVQFVGFDTLIIHIPPFLKNENVEMRTELFNFINKYKDKFTKDIAVSVFKDMEENLLLCLQDKTANIRTQAEEMIKFSLTYIKLNNYYEKIQKYKPAITNDLKIILDKIQNDVYGGDNTNEKKEKEEININNNNDSNNTNKENKQDEFDIENEGNININEIINSNSKSNSNNKNGNGGSTLKLSQRNSFYRKKEKEKDSDNNYLKSNSTIIGTSSSGRSSINSYNSSNNKKFRKILTKQKSKNSVINKSLDLANKTFTKNFREKNKDKSNIVKSKDSSSKNISISNYKTLSNTSKRKSYEIKDIKDNDSSLIKSAQKETPTKSKINLSNSVNLNLSNKSNNKEKKNINDSSGKKLFAPFEKLKNLSNSLILGKKSDKKNPKKDDEIFCTNIKIIPNKTKRLENDLKFKFNFDYISKDSTFKSKIKEQSKNLFCDDFNKKIFCDDFKKVVIALKEMKEQLEKNINISIYLENLDVILKIIGIKLTGNLNPTCVKNLFEFFDVLYNIIKEKKYCLNEIELNIIISLLIDKISINNNILKEHLMKLLNEFIELSDINKTAIVILNNSLGKNNKIKTDVLDFIYDLNKRKKLNLSSKNYIKILGKYICINDNIVKSKILTLFKEIFSVIGEELFFVLDFLTDKDKEFLSNNLIVENYNNDTEEEIEVIKQPKSLNSSDDESDDYGTPPSQKKSSPHAHRIPLEKNILNGAINSEKELLNTLKKLSVKNETEQLNAIILIHEIIYQKYKDNKKFLIPNIDKIIETFIKVLHELFIENDIKNIPIKFTRYLTTVLLKISSNEELIYNLSYKVLSQITNELLNYLLIQGFDKIKDKQEEGNIIFKSINSTMLRIIENCNKTDIILVLLDIIKKYQKGEAKKLANLSVKCLLKATENLNLIINNLNIKKIFNEMHLIVFNYEQIYPELKNKQQTDDIILKFIRNFINNSVKIKQKEILDIYNDSIKKSDKEDKYIIYWIKNCLDNLNKNEKNMSLNISNISNKDNFNSNSSVEDKKEKEKEIENKIKEIEIENKKEDNKENNNDKNNDKDKEKNESKIEEIKKKWDEVNEK